MISVYKQNKKQLAVEGQNTYRLIGPLVPHLYPLAPLGFTATDDFTFRFAGQAFPEIMYLFDEMRILDIIDHEGWLHEAA